MNADAPHPADPNAAPAASDGDQILGREGWHVVHLFYQIDRTNWSLLSDEEQLEAKTNLTALIQEIRSTESTQLLAFSMVTPKADLAFMLLTADLHKANEFEKRLTLSLGPDMLSPVYSYLSMTELSEYTTTEAQYIEQVKAEDGLAEDSPEMAAKIEEFRARMKKYNSDRLYPNMPDWPVMCFYNMSKRRLGSAIVVRGDSSITRELTDNWYSEPFEERRRLMAGHARVGRTFAGRVRQLVTGSTGLDEAEWGVTLFSHTAQDIKEIVYDMRFDEASARFGEFGEFYIGLQMPLDALFRRVGL
ncbi:MAG: chlorite dismutase family protein [Akkermansiaceae bacterium]|nr:chlorite dismutase family protein [Akkermansiaceae bacterium]